MERGESRAEKRGGRQGTSEGGWGAKCQAMRLFVHLFMSFLSLLLKESKSPSRGHIAPLLIETRVCVFVFSF